MLRRLRTSFHPFDAAHSWLVSGLLVFLVAFGVFLYLQASPTFADPDSFYHAKMALLIRDGHLTRTFPWLPFTTLGDHFTDQHFLYHVLLIPFVSVFPPLLGIKIATIFLAAGAITAVYWLLKRFGVPFAAFWALLLVTIHSFIFRMSLAKAPSLSIILLVAGIWLIVSHRTWWLMLWGALYVWFYGAFLLLLVCAGAYVVGRILMTVRTHGLRGVVSLRFLRKEPSIRGALAVLGGIALGLVINPFFPNNLYYYWEQIYEIGIKNYRDVIGVGGEWYPTSVTSLITNNVFITIIVGIGGIISIIFRKWTVREWMLFLLTIFFTALTLKSRRYVEYSIPVSLLFGVLALQPGLRAIPWGDLKRWFRRRTTVQRFGLSLVVVYFLIALPWIVVKEVGAAASELHGGRDATALAASSAWLKEHTPEGSVVVHSSWDEFPVLFYQNSHNAYIGGLDQTFLYLKDQERYWAWVDLTLGKRTDAATVVRGVFGSDTVLVVEGHDAMKRVVEDDPAFTEVYHDDEATLFQLR